MSEAYRTCGSCTACCHTLLIEELDKPAFADCAHACNSDCGSCGIYQTRPSACSNFRCMWLDGHLAENDRPDQLGVIFTTTYEPKAGVHPLLIEVRPGATQAKAITAAIEQMTQKSPVLVLTAESGTFHPRKHHVQASAETKTPLTIHGQAA